MLNRCFFKTAIDFTDPLFIRCSYLQRLINAAPLSQNLTHIKIIFYLVLGKVTLMVSKKFFFLFFVFLTAGLIPLQGIKHKLRYIDLHSNCVDSIHHLLQCVVGLHFLTNLILEKNGEDNPVCRVPGMSD